MMRNLVVGLILLLTLGFADTLLVENFDAPWTPQNPPPGWKVIYDSLNPQNYADWHREPANAAPWTDHPSPYPAIFWQLNQNQTPDILISPVINCATYRNIVLTCSTYFSHRISNSYTAQIRYSIDGGQTFPYVLKDYYEQNVGPGVLESFELPSATRRDSVVIAWVFQGDLFNINWWMFDDVVVTGDSILTYDIRCQRILEPDYFELPGNLYPRARFRNIGLQDQYDIPVYCELFDSLGNSLYLWQDTIDTLLALTGEKVSFFDSTSFPLTGGHYSIKFWCAADSDYNRANDTLTRNFVVSTLEEIANDNGTPAGYRTWPVGHYGWGAKFSISNPVFIESLKVYLNSPVNPAHSRYQLAIAPDLGTGMPGPFIFKTPVLYAAPGAGWNSVFVADTGEQIPVVGDFYVFYLQVGEPPECPQLANDGNLNNPNNYWTYYRDGTMLPETPPGDLMLRVVVNHDPLTPSNQDARVTFIEQPLYEFIQRPFDAPCPIRAHIENFGIDSLYNIPVRCSVIDITHNPLFTGSATIAALGPGDKIAVDFNGWVPTIASQPCSVIVYFDWSGAPISDEVPQNDEKRFGFDLVKGAYTGRVTTGYAWIDSDTTGGPVYSWIDTNGANIAIQREDEYRIFVPIGFNFPYSDTTYNNCYVCTNGWLSLGYDPHEFAPNPQRIPNSSLPNALIAPWWADHELRSAGKVYYKTIGQSPNRQFVVIWQNVNLKYTDTTDLVTFEAILNENGTVVFQYQDVTTGDLNYDYGKNTSIGMENKEGDGGVNYLYSLSPLSAATNDPQNRLTSGRAIKLYREFRDAAALDIVTPATYTFPETLYPQVKIQNYGTVGDSIRAYLRIMPGDYFDSVLVTGLAPGAETTVTMPSTWYGRGTFSAVCSTAMAGDINPTNDIFSKVFISSSWVQREDIPIGPARRKVKNASLVYAPAANKLYALKGGNTNEFYSYDIATGTWESLPSMPLDPSGKKAKEGCDLTYDQFTGTQGTIWAIKGGGVPDFYSFDIASRTWQIKRSVSVRGFTFRWPKIGAALAYVPTHGPEGAVYCATGNNSLTFVRYDIGADTWARCPDVPFIPIRRRSCRYGTDMVYDGDSIIYLLKGNNTTEVWKYYPAFDSWYLTPLDQVSLIGNRNRRVKAGGAITYLNSNLYVLKGGNTQEFWSYPVGVRDSWVRRSDIPIALTGKRTKVKRGAALAATNSAIFCLKGSYVYEFWEYRPETDSLGNLPLFFTTPERQGVMAENAPLPAAPELALFPNPIGKNSLTILCNLPTSQHIRLTIYDATGAQTKNILNSTLPAGRHKFTWNLITDKGTYAPPGVYFLKLETGNKVYSRKLIVQR
jgi:hypothetical protein